MQRPATSTKRQSQDPKQASIFFSGRLWANLFIEATLDTVFILYHRTPKIYFCLKNCLNVFFSCKISQCTFVSINFISVLFLQQQLPQGALY